MICVNVIRSCDAIYVFRENLKSCFTLPTYAHSIDPCYIHQSGLTVYGVQASSKKKLVICKA